MCSAMAIRQYHYFPLCPPTCTCVFFSEPLDFPRSWMLPAMRDHIRQSELGYFTTALLPLAGSLRAKGVCLCGCESVGVACMCVCLCVCVCVCVCVCREL